MTDTHILFGNNFPDHLTLLRHSLSIAVSIVYQFFCIGSPLFVIRVNFRDRISARNRGSDLFL